MGKALRDGYAEAFLMSTIDGRTKTPREPINDSL